VSVLLRSVMRTLANLPLPSTPEQLQAVKKFFGRGGVGQAVLQVCGLTRACLGPCDLATLPDFMCGAGPRMPDSMLMLCMLCTAAQLFCVQRRCNSSD
jgi:hypothetical protein